MKSFWFFFFFFVDIVVMARMARFGLVVFLPNLISALSSRSTAGYVW